MNYEIIPQAPRYEMNGAGVIRNRKTGKFLKWYKTGRYNKTDTATLMNNGKKIRVSRPSLLWQLYGSVTSKTVPVAVSLQRGTRTLRFDSLKACAGFLARVVHLTKGAVRYHLTKRRTKIADWEIRYIDPKENPVTKGIV